MKFLILTLCLFINASSDTSRVNAYYPVLLGTVQLYAAITDGITTRMCMDMGQIKGFPVYERDPLISIPFGKQPTITEFIAVNMCSMAATYLFVCLIRKNSSTRKVWWIPQTSLIIAHSFQTNWNYRLYERLKRV